MAGRQDAIDFEVLEGHKENIQALPSGRSAKKLAAMFSPRGALQQMPTPTDVRNANDAVRMQFEDEIASIDESDDPLDVYHRYVKWTLDAYPSAQATPQSGLRTLLERATKAFTTSTQYKNDPRYVKLWVHYITFFSDAPREAYVFLSRHGIGEDLALFYEEYAAWLEGAGRWGQAEEIYKLGIERQAQPAARLLRKFGEFEQRRARQPTRNPNEPTSPALPAVRPVLATKVDPFALGGGGPVNPQAAAAAARASAVGGGGGRPGKAKMAIFSDAGSSQQQPAISSRGPDARGWDNIGSTEERKKENTMEARPWVGETLPGVSKKPAGPKMAVFRDANRLQPIKNKRPPLPAVVIHPSEHQVTVHPQTGKKERVFVDLETIYPTPKVAGTELSFEEVWALNQGWLNVDWDAVDEAEMMEQQVAMEMDDDGDVAMDVDGDGDVDMDMDVDVDMGQADELYVAPPVPPQPAKKLMVRQDTIRLDGVDLEPKGVRSDGQQQDQKNRAMQPKEQASMVTKVPLRPEGDENELVLDENGAVMEMPKGGKKKKKIMEINETQIIKARLDSPPKPKMKKRAAAEPTMTMHTKAATDDIYEIFNQPLKPGGYVDQEEESIYETDYETEGDYTSVADSEGTTQHVLESEIGEEDDDDDDDDDGDAKSVGSGWSDFTAKKNLTEDEDVSGALYGGPESPPRTRTIYIPIPPEDYEAPTRPYRDAAEMANNRLPFMTPITEQTEMSLNIEASRRRFANTKSLEDALAEEDEGDEDDLAQLEQMSSPILPGRESPSPLKPKKERRVSKQRISLGGSGPLIQDAQCNPVHDNVQSEILEKMQPTLQEFPGFFDHREEEYGRGNEIRKYAKAVAKSKAAGGDRVKPVVVSLPDMRGEGYVVKKELGAGAFAPVYLVEKTGAFGSGRSVVEALKMENPPSAWEFRMMRLAHARLGNSRITESISTAHELYLYRDEAFLVLEYHPHGTLLGVVNFFRSEPSGVMDETLAMFFTIELLRTVEGLHAFGILHGDLKADNCMLRLGPSTTLPPLTGRYRADGTDGWSARGLSLIDFGRAIYMPDFVPGVQFVADWKPAPQDCSEVREGRPWTWQIDYFGLAGVVHCLLFGRYMDTTRVDGGEINSRRYRIREGLKRYWQTEMWGDLFDVLLNPAGYGTLPVAGALGQVRRKMEAWLEENGERGVGLRGVLGKVEAWAARGRR